MLVFEEYTILVQISSEERHSWLKQVLGYSPPDGCRVFRGDRGSLR